MGAYPIGKGGGKRTKGKKGKTQSASGKEPVAGPGSRSRAVIHGAEDGLENRPGLGDGPGRIDTTMRDEQQRGRDAAPGIAPDLLQLPE